MRCSRCTQTISDRAVFCPHCGARTALKAPRPSSWFSFLGLAPGLLMVALLGLVFLQDASIAQRPPAAVTAPAEVVSSTSPAPAETRAPTVGATAGLATPAPSETPAPTETPAPSAATSTPPPTATPQPSATPTPAVLTRAQIEAAVRDAVERFQRAKEYSQRTGDTSRLAEDLRGQALERQIQLVNETRAANCYWEISLDSPMSYEFVEIRGDEYVLVKVNKTETTRKYCKGQFVPGSSQERDNYDTSYIVQRIDSRWYVTGRE